VRLFSTASDSVSITSVVSKYGLSVLRSVRKQRTLGRVGDGSHVGSVKKSLVKRKRETVRCRDATASSFVAKGRGEVFAYFHAVTVEVHSSMWNWLFGLPGRILCEQSPWYQRKWWACSWLFPSRVSPFSVCLNRS
jgi:hypothetical protein